MRKLLENFFTVAALVGTEAWFLKGYFSNQPDFEPALAFIAALGAALAKDPIRARFVSSEEPASVHDKELFRSFTNLLLPNETSKFFKEHDFGGPFPKSEVAPLYSFVNSWGSVDKEFLDEKLELKRKAIYALAGELVNEIGSRTVPIRSGDFISVFSDQQRATGQPRPISVIEDAKILNEKSSLFASKYEEFVRLCKVKLEK
jgi:hypothetical protein